MTNRHLLSRLARLERELTARRTQDPQRVVEAADRAAQRVVYRLVHEHAPAPESPQEERAQLLEDEATLAPWAGEDGEAQRITEKLLGFAS